MLDDFQRLRTNSPAVPSARLERGLAALEDGNDSAATDNLNLAAQLSRREFEVRADSIYITMEHVARFWQGASLARSGHHADAISTFQQSVAADSLGMYSAEALYAIGQVYERNQEYDKSIEYFYKVRTAYPSSSLKRQAQIREAQNYVSLRKPERALDVLGDAESDDAVKLLRASALIQRGRYDLGLDTVSRIFNSQNTPGPINSSAHLHAGYALLHLGKFGSAIEHFRYVLDSSIGKPSNERNQALLYNAIALKRGGAVLDAERIFADLASAPDYPFQSQALVEVGQGAYERGEFDEAQKAFERAERSAADPNTLIRARLLLGATLIEKQQWTRAAQVYERAEALSRTASDAYVPNRTRYLAEARLKKGICLVQANDRRGSIAALTEFLGNHPDHPQRDEATFWLAEAMYKADLLKNAGELYDEIVKKYTVSIRREEAMYGLAWTYFRRRDFKRSVDVFGELIKSFPASRYAVEAMVRRGDGLYVMKQFQAAAQQYSQAAGKSPRSEEGQYAGFQAGHALYRADVLEKASAQLRDFVAAHSSSKLADDALFLIGWIEFQKQNDSAAIVEFNKLLAAFPEGDQAVRALYTIADAQYNLGNVDAAMNTYRSVISRFPSHPLAAESAKSMQIALIGMGRTDEALQIADSLISVNPNSIVAEEFAFKKAEIFYTGRNYPNAVSELEAYMKKYPTSKRSDEVIYLLGKTYLNMDDVNNATKSFADLEKRYPESPLVPTSVLDLATYYDGHANSAMADSLYGSVMLRHADDTAAASRAGFERATLARARGDSVKALEFYTITANRYAGSEYGDQARYQIAMYYRKLQITDSAVYHLSILTQSSGNPLIGANALYDIGDIYQRSGNWTSAADAFERVRRDFAGYEDWYTLSLLSLGNCYEELERFDEARSAYLVVTELRPDDDYGKTAASRLSRLERRRP